MAREFFHLVEHIVAEEKYFEVSRQEIARELARCGEFGIEGYIDLTDDGEEVSIPVELRISYRNGRSGWHIVLLLHKERIDGIDFEQRYTDMEGGTRSGWHRHQWNPDTKEAKIFKQPVTDLDDVETVDEFLIRVCALLRVRLNPIDHGTLDLF